MTEPEIHHIGHPTHDNMTCCGIPMPPEQMQVRPRGRVHICQACAERFKLERLRFNDEPADSSDRDGEADPR